MLVKLLTAYSHRKDLLAPLNSLLDAARQCQFDAAQRSVPGRIRTAPRLRQRILNEQQIDSLVEEYQDGDSTYALAQRYGVSRQAVRKHLDRRGLLRPIVIGEIDPAMTAEILRLHSSGLPITKVATELGVGWRAVTRVLDSAGVPRRTRSTTTPRRDG